MRAIETGHCSLAIAATFAACAVGAAEAAMLVVPTQHATIQAAINAAVNGDTVLVLDGVYSGAGNYNIDLLGKSIALESASGPQSCIIDVQATQQNQRMGFHLHSGESGEARISGFTIRHGLSFNGPAMTLLNASPVIENCVFTENHANCWGGAVYFDGDSSPRFVSCRFIDNYSTDDGGAVFGFNGSPVFDNCLFANNTAPSLAGAILTWGSGDAPRLINCTVAGNHAAFGAAVYTNNLVVENSIIHGNTGDDQQIIVSSSNTVVVRYSNVQGGWSGEGNINALPQFADNDKGDYHLLAGSPCIDAGDPATVVPEGMFDSDGDPRQFGVRVDMGVDEFRRTGDVDGDHLVDINDLLGVIAAWGPCTWSLADINGDFQVNIDDLLMVIASWG